MSRDTILISESGKQYSFDNLATQKWLEGKPVGVGCAAKYIRDKAVDLFRDGKHEEAIKMQKLAADIEADLVPRLHDDAKNHAMNHPFELGDE